MANARFRCPTRSTGAVQTRYATHGIADDEATRWQHAACESPDGPSATSEMQRINGSTAHCRHTTDYGSHCEISCNCSTTMQLCACGWQELCQKGYSAALMGENFVEASVEVRFAHRPQRHARTHARTQGRTDAQGGTDAHREGRTNPRRDGSPFSLHTAESQWRTCARTGAPEPHPVADWDEGRGDHCAARRAQRAGLGLSRTAERRGIGIGCRTASRGGRRCKTTVQHARMQRVRATR